MARGVDGVRLRRGADDEGGGGGGGGGEGEGGVVRIRETERQRLLSVLRVCMAAVEAATRLPAATAAFAARVHSLRKGVAGDGGVGGGGGGDGGGGPGRCHCVGGGSGGGGGGGFFGEGTEGRDADAGLGFNPHASLVAERNSIIRTLEMASSLLQDVVPNKEGAPSPPPPSLRAYPQNDEKNYRLLSSPDTQRRAQSGRASDSPRNTSASDRFGPTYKREEWRDNNYEHLFSPSRLKKLIKDDQIITSKQRPTVRSASTRKTNNYRTTPQVENRENNVIKEVSIVPSRRIDMEKKQMFLKGREKTFLVPQTSKSKIPPSRPPACLNPRHASAHPRLTGRVSPKLWGGDTHSRKKPTARELGSRIPTSTSTTPSQTSSCSSKSAVLRNRRCSLQSAPTHRTWSQPLPKSTRPTSQFPPTKTSVSKSNHSQQQPQGANKTHRADIRVHKDATGDGTRLKKSLTMLTFDVPGRQRSRGPEPTKPDSLKKAASENKWFTKKKVKRDSSTNIVKRNIRSANESSLKLSREKTFDIPKAVRNK